MKFNAVKIKEHRLVLAVSTQFGGPGTVRFACISFSSVCLVQQWWHWALFSLRISFTPFAIPS